MPQKYAEEMILLSQGAEQLILDIPSSVMEKNIQYLDLLTHWNSKINLTAIRERRQMIHGHILDSWSLVPHLTEDRTLLDVGSGAGLPGIPVALLCPTLAVFVMESNGKKAAFLRQCKIELGLENVTVLEDRVENYRSDARFDKIVCRAFSDLSEFVSGSAHLLSASGEWLAMKGMLPYDEMMRVSGLVEKLWTSQITVPGLSAERHFVHMTPMLK